MLIPILKICLFLISLDLGKCENFEKRVTLDNIGIAYTIQNSPLSFYAGTKSIVIQRLHSTPISSIPLSIIKESLKAPACAQMANENSISANLQRFTRDLRNKWTSKIMEIVTYKKEQNSEPSNEYLYAQEIINKSRQKRETSENLSNNTFTDEVQWVPLKTRTRRELATILTSISAIGSIISNAVAIGISVRNEVRYADFEAKNRHILKAFAGNANTYASLSSILSDDLHSLSHALCARTKSDHLKYTKNIVNSIISDYMISIESEVLNLSAGRIPMRLEFFQLLMSICEDNQNSEIFCRKVINRQLIKLEWVTTKITKEMDLLTEIKLEIPVESPQFSGDTRLIELSNTGYFSNNLFYKIELPKYSLEKNNRVFSLNLESCSANICNINSIFSNVNTVCLESILKNSTYGCSTTNYGYKQEICNFENFGEATLVTASQAVFSSTNFEFKEKVFRNQTKVLTQNGKLICNYELLRLTKTFYLNNEIKASISKNKIKFDALDFKIDESNFTIHQTLRLNFSKEIEKLKESDDHLFIGETNFPTFYIICFSFSLNLVILILYNHRKLIIKKCLMLGQKSVIFQNSKNCKTEETRLEGLQTTEPEISTQRLYPECPQKYDSITLET